MSERNSILGTLPASVVVYLVGIGFWAGGIAMWVKSLDNSVSKLEGLFAKCCVENGAGTKVFANKDKS